MSLMMESISEDSRMSVSSGGELSNLSPCKTAASTRNATAVNKQHQALKRKEADSDQFRHRSWFEQIEEEERLEALQKSSASETKKQSSTMDALPSSDSKMSLDESNSSGSSSDRKIEIDILDSANVEKFEKLIRSDKIKSPFKRRLSGEGDDDGADGDNDGHAEFCEQQPVPEQTEGDDGGNSSKGAAPHKHKKTKTHEDDHGRERFRRESTDSGDGSSQSSRKPVEYEKDIEILMRRQKQIDYGKNTLGYENYMRQVPREQRTKDHPRTPPKHFKYSRRAWDGLVKVWRKQLHCFDPNAQKSGESD